jgi:hypothetical protein
MTIHIAYDARSGKIISVHHGATDAADVRQRAHKHSKIEATHIAVIDVKPGAAQPGKRYKVDPGRKTLVEAAAGEGIGFSVGSVARMPRK